MNKDSKIFIAGHRGLVGSAIHRELVSQGYNNLVLRTHAELDLTNQAEVENFFKNERPEYVFLAAAKVGGIVANSKYKAEFIYDNIMIAVNVIHSSWKYGVKKLLNLGSSCIYPKLAPQPMKEEYLLSGYLEPTNDAYAVAKIAAIKMCNSYNEQYGTNFISAMPTNLYGPGDNFNLETSHVFPAILRKMYLGKCLCNDDLDSLRKDLQKNPIENVSGDSSQEDILVMLEKYGITGKGDDTAITLWGDGSPRREFLYSEDMADAALFLMCRVEQEDMKEGFVNVGTGIDLTIMELAGIVKGITGFNGKVIWDKTKPNGTPQKLLDVSSISGLGWHASTDLSKGIKMAYDSFLMR